MSKFHIDPKKFLVLFVMVIIIDQILENFILVDKVAFTSPIIDLLLFIYFAVNGKKLPKKVYIFMLLGLFFSIIGMMVLTFDASAKIFFSHLAFIFLLSNISFSLAILGQWKKPKSISFWIMPILFIVYAFFIYSKLEPNLGRYNILIILNTISIIFMVTVTLGRSQTVDDLSFILLILGTTMLAISYIIFAANKFYVTLPIIRFFNTFTHTVGLYLMVYGLLASNESKN